MVDLDLIWLPRYGYREDSCCKSLDADLARWKYKKSRLADLFMFRTSFNAIDDCVTSQEDDGADLLEDELVYSSASLLECIRKHERDCIFVDEAELKTYPAKFLSKSVTACLSKHFELEECLIVTDLKNPDSVQPSKALVYDLRSDHFREWRAGDSLPKNYVGVVPSNVDGEIAGTISYFLTLDEKPEVDSAFLKQLVKIGDYYGYDFVAKAVIKHRSNSPHKHLEAFDLQLKFEAKCQSEWLDVEDKLYHVSPLDKKDKILRFGLEPRAKASMINSAQVRHKDRVYLFNGYRLDAIQSFVNSTDKRVLRFDSKTKRYMQIQEFAVFEIDKKKIPSLKLYKDSMFALSDTAQPATLYTYSNISPSAIKFIGTIGPSKKQ